MIVGQRRRFPWGGGKWVRTAKKPPSCRENSCAAKRAGRAASAEKSTQGFSGVIVPLGTALVKEGARRGISALPGRGPS